MGRRLPNPTIVSYNTNGLSFYSNYKPDNHKRRKRYDNRRFEFSTPRAHHIFENLFCLSRSYDIVLLQETHLHVNENGLNLWLPDCTIFYNNRNSSSAGTAIIIRNSFLEDHDFVLTHGTIIPGYIQHITFNPSNANSTYPFTVFNIYLTTHSHQQQIQQMQTIIHHFPHPPRFSIWGGDFNGVESPDDVINPFSSTVITGKRRKNFQDLKLHFHLTEAHQPIHTHYRISVYHKRSSTARLDRFYTSYSDTDKSLFQPDSHIPHVPHSFAITHLTQLYKNNTDSRIHTKTAPSDHIPIGLRFLSTAPRDRKTRPSIPLFLFASPISTKKFRNAVIDRWNELNQHVDEEPFTRLLLFKSVVHSCSRRLIKDHREAPTRTADKISLTVKALRLLDCGHPVDSNSIVRLLRRYPDILNNAPPTTDPHFQQHLISHLDELLNLMPIPTHDSIDDGPRPNIITEIKPFLPSKRQKILRLRCPDTPDIFTHNPHEMNNIARDFWEKIWKEPTVTRDNEKKIDKFLNKYQRKIPFNPLTPLLKDIEHVITKGRSSAPGPDGIPLTVYKALIDVVSPLLLDVLHGMMSGYTPPPGFNFGSLNLIPKKNTHLISDTRPISIPNTDNRILSSCLRNLLQPVMCEFLHFEQKGFLDRRHIHENIHDINSAYYTPHSKQHQSFLLLLDFEKAFDSVSHTFLLTLLSHIGLPEWFSNCVDALLSNLRVFPSFTMDDNCFIRVQRGVKQGCPLSPLLFNILIDTIIHLTRRIPNLITRGFADDLAFSFPHLGFLDPVIDIVDQYCNASAGKINQLKTIIIPTLSPSIQQIDFLATSKWPNIRFAKHGRYLGVLIGYDITIMDIYKNSLTKFTNRITPLLSLKSTFTLKQRIIISNVFLIPIFSYLIQFYLIPLPMLTTIYGLLRQWVVPLGGNAFKLTCLTLDPAYVGLKTNLKNVELQNLSALGKFASKAHVFPSHLRIHTYTLSVPQTSSSRKHTSSLLIFDHVRVATLRIKHTLEVDVWQGGTIQAIIYESLLLSKKQKSHALNYLQKKLAYFSSNSLNDTRSLSAKVLVTNWNEEHLWKSLSNAHCLTFIKLLYHAWGTLERLRNIIHRERRPRAESTCVLCLEDDSNDSIIHYFHDCVTVNKARKEVSTFYECVPFARFKLKDFTLATTDFPVDLCQLAVVFIYAVHKTRRESDARSSTDSSDTQLFAFNRIRSLTILEFDNL